MSMQSNWLSGECVEDLFVAALGGDVLTEALDQIARVLPGTAAMLICQDSVRWANNFLIHSGGPHELAAAFRTEPDVKDAWPSSLWTREPGRIYFTEDVCAQGKGGQRPGPVAQALSMVKPALDGIAGAVVSRTDSRQIAFELRYPSYRDGELRPFLRNALPRFVRQLNIALRIAATGRHAAETDLLADSLLDLISLPVVLFDQDFRVVRANARARSFVAAGNFIAIAPDRTLHLLDPANDLAFSRQIAALKSNGRQRVAVLAMHGSDVSQQTVLSVARIKSGLPASQTPPLPSADEGPLFALIFEDFSRPIEISSEMLWQVFKLSPREAELAVSLLAGESIGTLAQRRSISKETLRNQLAVVMRKTSTSRQQDLVALLARLAVVNAVV